MFACKHWLNKSVKASNTVHSAHQIHAYGSRKAGKSFSGAPVDMSPCLDAFEIHLKHVWGQLFRHRIHVKSRNYDSIHLWLVSLQIANAMPHTCVSKQKRVYAAWHSFTKESFSADSTPTNLDFPDPVPTDCRKTVCSGAAKSEAIFPHVRLGKRGSFRAAFLHDHIYIYTSASLVKKRTHHPKRSEETGLSAAIFTFGLRELVILWWRTVFPFSGCELICQTALGATKIFQDFNTCLFESFAKTWLPALEWCYSLW